MKHGVKKIACTIMAGIILTSVVSAANSTTVSWDHSGGGYGVNNEYENFWPATGSTMATFYSSYANTRVTFTYTADAVSQLNEYREDELYPGMELKDIPSGLFDNFSAYSITSNMPNCVTDLENNDLLGSRNDEAEVTALGLLVAGTQYNMSINWTDYRDGSSAGWWRPQAELSKQGVKDYNVQDYKYLTPVVEYGASKGTRSLVAIEEREEAIIGSDDSVTEDALMATITFNNYLSFDEFARFMDENPVTIAQLQLRGVAPGGERVSIFTRTDKGLAETEQLLLEQASNEGFSVVGITSVYALVDEDQLNEIDQDRHTYTIDVAVDEYDSTVQLCNGGKTANCGLNGGFPKPLTWEMEDAGILSIS